jgi:uncharacterized membrane protein
MNKAGIRWLYQELPDLIARGVLAQESADKLRQHYGQVKSTSKTTAMLIILGTLGSFLIGLGIILLLAHNWEQFSRFTRAILSFVPLVLGQGLALWVLQKKPQSGAFKEGAATFLSLMVGASISLISQTYNISTDASTFILTWMFLIIPITYLMQASMPAAIYLIGITSWSGIYGDEPAKAILFWPLAAVIMPHFIWAIRQEIYALRTAILSFAMIICVSFAAAFSLGKTWPGSWVIISSSIYAIFYFIGHLKVNRATTDWQRPLRFVGELGLFILAFLFTFRFAWQNLTCMVNFDTPGICFLADNIITIAIVVIAALLFYSNVKRKNLMVALSGAVPLLALVAYWTMYKQVIMVLLIFNVYLFVLSVRHITLGIRSSNLSVVNKGMFMLAVLIIARFFDSDIGFVMKGLAFIIVGIGFLAVNLKLARRLGGGR